MPHPSRRPLRNRSSAWLVALTLAAGCATPSGPSPSPSPSPPPSAPPPVPPSAARPSPAVEEPGIEPAVAGRRAETEAWSIPPGELGTRRLYRVRYQGPDGQGSFRLTLELTTTDRYRARAVDLFGRPLWSLSFEHSRGLWIDHRAEVYCRLVDRLDLAGLPLAPFPLAVLPPLLLGRLPEPPAPGNEAEVDAGELTLVDGSGRRWTASLAPSPARPGSVAAGSPTRWSLWGAEKGSPPHLTWLRSVDGEAVLSDRLAGVQLRWREVVAQPLGAASDQPSPPASYRRVSCREAYGAPPI